MKKTIAIIILTAIITAGLTLGAIFMFARHGGDDTQATTDDAKPAGRISSDTKSGSVVTCAHAHRSSREPFYDNMGDGEEDTFCTATFLFSLDAPERISAASLDQAGYLTVLVRSTIVSGGYAWFGSSTDLGASIIISDKDGNVLIEEPRCCTDDYTYNVKRTGDVIISEHRFYAKDQPGGSFAPGEYDITVLHYGQSELYSSRLTVTE